MNLRRALTALLISALALVGLVGTAHAAGTRPAKNGITTITVYHRPVTPTSVTGSGLGTVRTYFFPIAINGKAADGQYMTGTLTTIAQGLPDNQEIRASNLIFVMGSQADQLVVGGQLKYNTGASVLAVDDTEIRPVIGGSGKYLGAVGEVISTNLGANGWIHVFKIRIP